MILDKFKGQKTSQVLNLLQSHTLFYVSVSPNCTDHLQPLDVSVNRAAKQLLSDKFENWYADNIGAQKDTGKELEPVEMQLAIVKPITAK